MKKRVLVLVVGFLFVGVSVFAADGDLIVNGNATVNGNVGIGTTTPGYKLDVQGQIRATQGVIIYVISNPVCSFSNPNNWVIPSLGMLTTSASCQTGVCGYGESWAYYYDCAGNCSLSTTPFTCSNTLLGRLVAP